MNARRAGQRLICSALAASIALAGSAATAAPSVFVPAGGNAWWTADNAQGRVIGKSAGLVTAESLSKHIEATQLFDPYKVCALTAVVADTYVGMGKSVQDDITRTMSTLHLRVEGVTPDGRRFVAQSVLYEACNDPENRGAAVVVTDARTSEILLLERMGVFTSNRSPIWTAFLQKPDAGVPDAPLFTYSHCTECGAATAVYYDVTRKKLYTEYNGH